MLPNLYCAGTTKAGTSTLYEVMKQHTEIYFSYAKELHFYNVNHYRGVDWYKKQFSKAGKQKYIADFTPAYFIYKSAPQKMLELSGPDTKFIFMIRNPVDRLYSNIWMMQRLMEEPENTVEEMAEAIENGADYDEQRYINLGMYYKNIKNYMEVFPQENMHFVIFDDFIKDVEGECKKIFTFLGLKEQSHINYEIWANKTTMPTNFNRVKTFKFITRHFPNILRKLLPNSLKKRVKSKLQKSMIPESDFKGEKNPDTCRRLMKIYKEDLLNLSSFLDRDLSHWISKYDETGQ